MHDDLIRVPATNTGEQIAVLIRQIALAVLPLLTFYNITTERVLMMWVSAIGTIVVLVWGQVKTVRRLNQLRGLANLVPDSVAIVDCRGDGTPK